MKKLLRQWQEFIEDWKQEHLVTDVEILRKFGKGAYLKPDFADFMQWLLEQNLNKSVKKTPQHKPAPQDEEDLEDA